MGFLESIVLSITMAADAMCAGASDGIKEHKIKISKCIIIALCFGFAQFLMPVIGYFIGYAVYDYIDVYVPWIAFSVMLILGLKSIIDGIKEYKERKKKTKDGEVCELETKVKPLEIFIQTIATSIDALSVGFSLIGSVPEIFDAMMVFTTIGVITFLLSFLTILFGKKIGVYVEKFAPFISGLFFIGLSIKFLVEAITMVI